MEKIIVIFLGPPGSGKGTQTTKLAYELNIPVVSTGNLFRNEVAEKTELGLIVEDTMNKGNLISTELTNQILEKRLNKKDAENGFILDGYPRKEDQIEYAQNKINYFLKNKGKALVFYIDIDDDLVKERISGRRICACGASFHTKYSPSKVEGICDICGSKLVQRVDDSEESVIKRLEEFHKGNKPLLEYFSSLDYFFKINGNQDVEKIYSEILEIIKK